MSNFDHKEVKEKIIAQIKHIFDPEIPVNIYDLGLIYEVNFEEEDNRLICNIVMTLTSPTCPVSESLLADVHHAANAVDEVDEANVNLTFEPPWDKTKVSEEGQELMLSYGFLI